MERLRFALDAAQGAPSFGVKSNRESSYRLNPPTDGEARYTADVVVATTVQLIPDPNQEKAPDGANAATHEKEKFKLVYQNDRWELPEKPESETLQLCFESALKDE